MESRIKVVDLVDLNRTGARFRIDIIRIDFCFSLGLGF